MELLINTPHASHVLSETQSRRVYRFNGAILIDVKVDGEWLTVAVL